MTYRLRITAPGWSGKVDGKDVKAKQGDVLDVDLATFTALCMQRELAEPVPVEEIVEMARKMKLDKPVALGLDKDIKRLKRPTKDKMVRTPVMNKMGPVPRD